MYLGEIKYKVGEDSKCTACFSTERKDKRGDDGSIQSTKYNIKLIVNLKDVEDPLCVTNVTVEDLDEGCSEIVKQYRDFVNNFDPVFQKYHNDIDQDLNELLNAQNSAVWLSRRSGIVRHYDKTSIAYLLTNYSTDQPSLRILRIGIGFFYKTFVCPFGTDGKYHPKRICADDHGFVISKYYATVPYLRVYAEQFIAEIKEQLLPVRDALKTAIDQLTPIIGENHEQ